MPPTRTPPRPPLFARALLRVALPGGILRESMIGDLDEEFGRRVELDGEARASAWYGREALSLVWYAVKRRMSARRPHRSPRHRQPPHRERIMIAAIVLTDLRHAFRGLRRNPGPVLVSMLSLTLAIAAMSTMVSVVDAIDYRPLPYRDADGLVELVQIRNGNTDQAQPASPGLFLDWRDRTTSYEALAAASPIAVALDDDDRALGGARASDEFFTLLGVSPRIGRVFGPDDVRYGERVAVISHDLWQGRFLGDADVIGRTVSLSWAGEFRGVAAQPFTVIGVLPRGARYPRGSDVWIPATGGFGESRGDPMLTVIGRLNPNSSVTDARAEMDVVGDQLATERPDAYEHVTGAVNPLREGIRRRADERGTSARFLLLLVAGFVLLLAVVNAATVFLVRAARHGAELRIRAALGAPRHRLLALLFGQSVIVSLVAGALGVLLSYWGIRLADARLAVSASGMSPVLDWRVVTAALVLSLAAGLAAGLLPAVKLGRPQALVGLGARTADGTGGYGGRLRGALVVAQVASALVLLNGAGILARDFVALITRDPGFETDRLLVAGLQLTTTLTEAAGVAEQIEGLPGVAGAAVGGWPAEGYAYLLESGDSVTGTRRPFPYRVSGAYFRTLGIPLLAGRAFEPADGAGSAPVAIVSQAAARTLWPATSPVGKRIFMGNTGGGEWVTVVGLTGDERVRRDMRAPVFPVLYRPWGQLPDERRRTEIFVRSSGDPETVMPPVREVLRQARGGEGWQGDYLETMGSVLGSYLNLPRFRASALSVFALFGLLLASMGVYGVVASGVNERNAEIGIRVALGARPADVLALVVRGGIGLAVVGGVVGLAGAAAVHRLLDSMVVANAGFDLVATVAAGAFLTAVVIVACYVPGRRATRVDPTIALRE